MRRALLGTRQHVQAAQHHLASAAPVPLRQFERPPRESQVDRDPHHLRHRRERRPPVQQVLVPIPNLPVLRCRSGETRQRKRRREHVLSKARVRVLWIERIDQQRIPRLLPAPARRGVQDWRTCHLGRAPLASRRPQPRLVGCNHGVTLHYKVLHVKLALPAGPPRLTLESGRRFHATPPPCPAPLPVARKSLPVSAAP